MDTLASVKETNRANTPAIEAKRPDRRTVLLSIGCVSLLAAAVWGVRWWTVGRFIESTDDAYLQADSVTIAPKVSGYVAEVYIGDNRAVTVG